MKLGQGYVFTHVCDSVHGGGVIPACIAGGIPACHFIRSPEGVPAPGDACSRGRVCVCGDPPWRLLLRTVRILLECILVSNILFDTYNFMSTLLPQRGKKIVTSVLPFVNFSKCFSKVLKYDRKSESCSPFYVLLWSAVADPRRALGTCAPSRSLFFHFHAVFDNNFPK